MSEFVHLHLHSQYSVLDGAIKFRDLIEKVKDQGQKAVAVTDHGTMHGAIEFYTQASAAGVQPILGCEVYVTSGDRRDRTPKAQGGAQTHHLTLLAQTNEGFRNLCRLVSRAYLEGFYFKPRVDHELLREHSQGVICLSGCIAGELSSFAQTEDVEGARKLISEYVDIFNDRYFIEIQPHNMTEQQRLNQLAAELAKEFTVPLVATNDCHYLSADDKGAQECLMCVSMGKLLSDPDRIRHDNAELHLKSAKEMALELSEFPDAISVTGKIADSCVVDFDFSTYRMPKFSPPKEVSLEDHFCQAARTGLENRLSNKRERGVELSAELAQVYSERLESELKLIIQMGFPGYFLVVSDFIQWAKQHSVPVGPGRGSAAGSLVAYALLITEIDPIEHHLLFERFLNPERVSMPDIDVDFCINGRERVIEYVSNKYGKDKVAQICTFGTLKAKAVIKDVGRAMGLSYAETDRIAKLVPAPRQGFDYPIAEALKLEPKLREYAMGEGKEHIELSQKLEGLSRHVSTHAAGLVIADEPVMDLLPLLVDKDGQVVTQYTMNWVEKIGLVKFDFLGLKTLTVIHDALKMVEEVHGHKIDVNHLPLDDAKAFSLITSGRTIGVFQLESGGITDMVGRLKPSCFEDIVAILALYRPGPLDAGMVDHYINRKHGRERVSYIHPVLEPILKETYGIILYQEQIMQIARDMAGYSLGEADMLRRAMGKKKPAEMAKQRKRFIEGATKRGVSTSVAEQVFDQTETFARYGFNRSHSVAYAFVSYQTAFLKAHYPACFMAALMSHEMHDTDKTLKNINECRELNIEVLPPNLNTEKAGFHVRDSRILFGLAAIRGVGKKAVECLVKERQRGGSFKSLLDFCRRIDASVLNRRSLEGFIKAGAFDWTGLARAELIERVEEVIRVAERLKAQAASKQIGLFESASAGGEDETNFMPQRELLAEWPSNTKLAHEKEALGFYLSGHPLSQFEKELGRLGAQSIQSLQGMTDGNIVTVAGVISLLKLKNTKKGDRYATFLLEDLGGTIEVIVWPDTYQKVVEVLSQDQPIVLQARLDVSDERRQLIASSIDLASTLREKTAREAIVHLDQALIDEQSMERLKSILKSHPGKCPVKLIITKQRHSRTTINLSTDYSIEASDSVCAEIEQLFGSQLVSFR